jgi:hypothetical protein
MFITASSNKPKSEYQSSEWAAHNSTIKDKRQLLRTGHKPKIGAHYVPPAYVPMVSIEIFDPKRMKRLMRGNTPTVGKQALVLLAMVGFFALGFGILGLFAH